MHRIFICVGVALLPCTSVQAQSSITIYGVVDAGLQISRFGNGTQFNLASGQADGSRFGIKGREELGGGYKAVINLEATTELDTGGMSNGYIASNIGLNLTRGLPVALTRILGPQLTPRVVVSPDAALFDRTSTVGLITPAGALLAGRQYTPAYEVAAMADTFEAGSAAGWGQVLQGPAGFITSGVAIRASNALQYRVESNGVGAILDGGLRSHRFVESRQTFLWRQSALQKRSMESRRQLSARARPKWQRFAQYYPGWWFLFDRQGEIVCRIGTHAQRPFSGRALVDTLDWRGLCQRRRQQRKIECSQCQCRDPISFG